MGTSLTSLFSNTIGSIVNNVNDAFAGKTSGIDVGTVVSELMMLERQPEVQLQSQQATISAQVLALTTIKNQISTLGDTINTLKDILGVFSQKTTGSSDANIVSAAADNTAVAGTHSILVSRLATTSSSYSGYLASDASLAGSQIDIKYGSDPNNPVSTDAITIPTSDITLQQAVSYINSGKFGVTASIMTDSQGSRLVFTSKTSGANGNLTVSSPGLNFTSSTGLNAQLTVDGVPVDSASNTVTGAIQGVTLSLGKADSNTTVLLSVQPDTTQASQAISAFVTAYNNVVSSINSQYTLNASGNEGILAGDSMLRTLQGSLLGLATTSVSGGSYVNLQSLGIEMQNNGTLQLNTAALSNALSSNFSGVQTFFQGTTSSGWGQAVSTQMQKLNDSTLGPVAVDINGLNQTSHSLADQIRNFEVRMTMIQDRLTSQYQILNTLLQQYPLQMSEVAAQLGSLPTISSSKSG